MQISTERVQLLQALDAERHALQNFVVLLQREQGWLVENQVSELLQLAQQKSNDALIINRLSEARSTLLQQVLQQNSLDANTITAGLAQHAAECLDSWQKLITLASEAQRMNNTNGELIQMHMRHNQQALTALNKANNKSNLYGPNGQQHFSPNKGRTLGTV